MRTVLGVGLVLALAAALGGCASREPTNTASRSAPAGTAVSSPLKFKHKNLVFVSFDALQAAHVGAYGNPREVTPTIDAIAREGFRFANLYSVASWTVPASMTWFTGVYPCEHRMTNKFVVYTAARQKSARLRELSPSLVTLAEVLQRAGYATGGFTGNAGVSGGFGYEQGFDTYFSENGRFGGFDRSLPRAIEWLRENRHKKFFLFLHGYDCHGQYAPSGGFDYRFVDPDYDWRYTGSEAEQEALREEGLERGQLSLREADVRFWRAAYDEKIHRADSRFRDFLAEFDRLGLMDSTLFVLTSDHGTELFEHRRFDHGFTLYDELIRVPLIIKLPGRSLPRTIEDRVSSIDLMPTILDLLDIDAPEIRPQLRGRSLVPTMLGAHQPRDCFSETDYREYTFKRSIVTPDGWKLIVTLETGQQELYNLRADPGETQDLSMRDRARTAELAARLFDHFRSLGHDLTARRWTVGLNPVYPSQGRRTP